MALRFSSTALFPYLLYRHSVHEKKHDRNGSTKKGTQKTFNLPSSSLTFEGSNGGLSLAVPLLTEQSMTFHVP